jgi:LysR family transcriptional regulator, low CO2-responsive transcriptional regulator
MDFDQLETFLEVARHNSFSRAAEKRFRTQPAISSLVRSLEEEVGAKLFDRSGGKVAMTAAGKVFQAFSEDALELRRVTIAKIGEMERIPRGEIVVGANEGTCLHILPEVFAQFKKQYTDVQVSVLRAERGRIIDFIIDNSVDFGIVSLPVADTRLQVVQIHRDELVVMTPPGHPLAKKKEVSVAEIAQYPLLLPKLGRTREAVDNLLHERRLKPKISMELDSSELMKRFVAADVGIGFVTASHVKAEAKANLLSIIRISDAQIKRDLALVFRKDKALSRAALAFIEIAVKLRPAEIGAGKVG